MMKLFILLLFLGLLLTQYMPGYMAYQRKHKNRRAILILTTFAGLTLFGWVGALVWAQTPDVEKEEYVIPKEDEDFFVAFVGLTSILFATPVIAFILNGEWSYCGL